MRSGRASWPSEGHKLISADYSQVELRVLAHIAGRGRPARRSSGAARTCTRRRPATILGTAPEDVDPGTRSKAKMVNYGIVYGLSAYGLADRLQIPQEEAQEFIDRYLDGFPKVKEFIDSTIEHAQRGGLRLHAVRADTADPGAARAAVDHALARRAAGREHGYPGDRGGHPQGRDASLPRCARPTCVPGSS